MKYLLTLLVFGFTMCTGDIEPDQKFSGSFKGNQGDLSLAAVLSVKDNVLRGTVILNGKPIKLSGLIKGSTSQGTFFDAEEEVSYLFTGKLSGDELRMSVTFPELNDEVIEVILHREAGVTSPIIIKGIESTGTESAEPESANPESTVTQSIGTQSPEPEDTLPEKVIEAKNPALIGTWISTEDFSSGTGDSHGSFSTEYFMQFKADGTLLNWTGRSAGSAGGVGISSEGESPANAVKVEWYTEGKKLYLIDPATREKESVLFYAEENRLMLHNGGKEKKILQRVR